MSTIPYEVLKTPLIQRIWDHGTASPNTLALTAKSKIHGWRTLTYRQLRSAISQCAIELQSLGIQSPVRVGLLMDNHNALEFMILILSIARLGAVFVPLNTRYSSRELRHLLDKSKCTLILFDKEFSGALKAASENLLHNVQQICIHGKHLNFNRSLSDISDSLTLGEIDNWPSIDMDSYTEIFSTSGTTGLPKAAAFTWAQAAASAHVYRTMFQLTSEDVLQSPFPVYVTAGTLCSSMPILTAGGHLIIDDTLEISDIVERMIHFRTTSYYAVPAFYMFLLEYLENHAVELPDMKRLMYGGSAMPLPTIEKIIELYPNIQIYQTFGGTETGATGTVLYPEMAIKKLDTVGVPMPFTEVRLVNEDGVDVPQGGRGEFLVRAKATFSGYLNDPEKTAEAIKENWVYTGDICTQDEDGFYRLVDRKKDIIIRGGHNIGSGEVEDVLYEHPGVREAAVVAVPHPKLGEEVFAFIALREDVMLSAVDIIEFCKGKMADYKMPKYVEFIDKMPRNSMEKIQKQILREKARQIVQN